jgi:hypothetical protein
MKTKLLALVVLAGSSMFAQTRYSNGDAQPYDRGGRAPAPSSYNAGRSEYRGENREYVRDENRRREAVSCGDVRHNRGFDRDDVNRFRDR